MSGHSKWSTIKHQKAAADQKRGQLFSKLSRAITIAAREGIDPETNFKLRLAIDKAKQANMPNSNISRALSSAQGKLAGTALEEVFYEGYGPAKVAVMVEVITDNTNRTVAEIKKIFERGGGQLVGPGAVAYLFKKVGLITLEKPADPQAAMLSIMDMGVENVEETPGTIEVYTQPGQLEAVGQKLQSAGLKLKEKELFLEPKTMVKIEAKAQQDKILKLMELLEDHDDVQKVFANFDFVD